MGKYYHKIEAKSLPLFFLMACFFVLANVLYAQKAVKINYINQSPPGNVAQVFAPGIITTNAYEHSAPAFSPDGNIVLWTVVNKDYRASLFEMKYENGKWSDPARPSFADSTADDYYPSFSTDGKKLYFSSRRKSPAGYEAAADMRIWQVEQNIDGWGKPVPFDTTASRGRDYAHSITTNGTIYFSTSMAGGTNFNICKSENLNGGYAVPVVLPYPVNSINYEDGPYVSPDESFLIFESIRPEGIDGSIDLYIAFKNKNGQWGMPVNMGPKINSAASERFAKLSPDGKFLFFGSSRNQSADNWGFDIFWIDASVIDELRTNTAGQTVIPQPLGRDLINALHQHDIESSARFLQQWVSLFPNNLDAVILYSAALRKLSHFSEAEQFLLQYSAQWKANANYTMELSLAKLALKKEDEAAALLAPQLMDGGQQWERYKQLSNELLQMKMFSISDEYFGKAMAINANMYEYQRRARQYALVGENNKAFENLDKAVQLGLTSKQEFESDEDLKTLRKDKRWQMLMRKLK